MAIPKSHSIRRARKVAASSWGGGRRAAGRRISPGRALVQAGAQVLHSSVSKRGDGTLQGNYTLRIKLTQFAAIVSAIERLGRVEGRDLRGQTLTAALPDRADRVNCDISLVLFERPRPIPSGSVGIAVQRMKDAEDKLAAMLSRIEGQVVSISTERRDDGTSASNLTIQVPLAKFDALLRGLESIGRIESRQVQGQEFGEVAGGAASVPCRLSASIYEKAREVPKGEIRLLVRNFREAADLFDKLVMQHKAEISVSNVSTRPDKTWAGGYELRVPATAAEALAADIEKLGRVQYKSVQGMGLTGAEKPGPDVMGRLTVRIEEMSALTPPEDEDGGPMRRAIIGGLKGLYASITVIMEGLIVIGPYVLLIALVVFMVNRARTKSAADRPDTPRVSETAASEPKDGKA